MSSVVFHATRGITRTQCVSSFFRNESLLETHAPFCLITTTRRVSVASSGFLPARSRNASKSCDSAAPRDRDAMNRRLLPFTSIFARTRASQALVLFQE